MRFYLVLLLFILPIIGQGHGYWFEISGSGKAGDTVKIKICFGEIDDYSVRHRETGPELAYTGSFKLFIVDGKGVRTDLAISPKNDCWEGVFVPHAKGTYQVLAVNEDLPVVDRSESGGQNVRPIEYLCAAYSVGSTEPVQKPVQFLDILVGAKEDLTNSKEKSANSKENLTGSKEKLTLVKAFKSNLPVKAKLRVFNPENWEKALTTDAKGEAVFFPTLKGLYIIRQDWNDTTPGTWQGKSYTAIRYRCNYCLLVK